MTVKIRLARGGAKKKPFYSIVVADSSAPRDGAFLEKLGTYNPMLPANNTDRIMLKASRAEYWLGKGAQPTDKVAKFLESLKVALPEHLKKKLLVKKKNYTTKAPKKSKEAA